MGEVETTWKLRKAGRCIWYLTQFRERGLTFTPGDYGEIDSNKVKRFIEMRWELLKVRHSYADFLKYDLLLLEDLREGTHNLEYFEEYRYWIDPIIKQFKEAFESLNPGSKNNDRKWSDVEISMIYHYSNQIITDNPLEGNFYENVGIEFNGSKASRKLYQTYNRLSNKGERVKEHLRGENLNNSYNRKKQKQFLRVIDYLNAQNTTDTTLAIEEMKIFEKNAKL